MLTSTIPLLPLKWQLTIPLNDDINGATNIGYASSPEDDTILYRKYHPSKHEMSIKLIKTHISKSLISPFKQLDVEKSSIDIKYEQKMDEILRQYSKHQYSDYVVFMLIEGFLYDQTSTICSIPYDIIMVVHQFYFEPENKYLRFANDLYKMTQKSSQTISLCHFSGEQLMEIIKNHHPYYQEMLDTNDNIQNAFQLCQELVQYEYIELAAYKLKFNSLFDDIKNTLSAEKQTISEEEQVVFCGDNQHFYRFTSDRMDLFNTK